jgi:hypothetical protein|tara:strand:- start:749 stop:1075 length:327 start_codon:yes stop_codon:yes gene_type:complete
MANSTTKEGKTAALISYIPVIGAPIAFFLNKDKRNYFASFHIRQTFGLNILYFFNKWIIYSYFGLTAGDIGKGGVLVLFILGGLGALKEQEKLVPFLGDKFQEWFKNI